MIDEISMLCGGLAGVTIVTACQMRRCFTPITRAIVTLLAALTAAICAHELRAKTGIDWNSVRTAIPYALAHGRPIYAFEGNAPLWCNIYPPGGHLLYTPVALMPSPVAAIVLGQLMSLVWITASLSAFTALASTRRLEGAIIGIVVSLLSIAWLGNTPVSDVALFVHVDAPAVGLVFLAASASLLAQRQHATRSAQWLIASGILGAAAIWTKQTMIGAVAVVALYVLIQNRGHATIFTFAFIGSVAVLAGLSIALFGAQPLWHSIMIVPSKHEFPGGFSDSLRAAIKDYATYFWPSMIVYMLLIWQTRNRTMILMGLITLSQLPLALLGAMKFGGGPNNYALSGIFLLGGIAIGLTTLATTDRYRTWSNALLSLALLISLVTLTRTTPLPETPNIHTQAYSLIRSAPGRYYFPWLPLSHLMAEGLQTHQSWGVLDRVMAGEEPPESWIRKYIPPTAEVICFKDPPDRFGIVYLRLRNEYSVPVQVHGLDGWHCWSKPVVTNLTPR